MKSANVQPSHLFILILILWVTNSTRAAGAEFFSRSSTNWNVASTWSVTACGGASAISRPTASDNVNICTGMNVTLTTNDTVTDLTIAIGGALTINAGALL